jgi:hypothetical protein
LDSLKNIICFIRLMVGTNLGSNHSIEFNKLEKKVNYHEHNSSIVITFLIVQRFLVQIFLPLFTNICSNCGYVCEIKTEDILCENCDSTICRICYKMKNESSHICEIECRIKIVYDCYGYFLSVLTLIAIFFADCPFLEFFVMNFIIMKFVYESILFLKKKYTKDCNVSKVYYIKLKNLLVWINFCFAYLIILSFNKLDIKLHLAFIGYFLLSKFYLFKKLFETHLVKSIFSLQ